jgi:hypothetical protein
VCGLSNVEGFTLERENAIAIPAHNRQTAHREGLGRVSLREDERALVGILAAGLVGVFQLNNAGHPSLLRTALATELLLLLELRELKNVLDDGALQRN